MTLSPWLSIMVYKRGDSGRITANTPSELLLPIWTIARSHQFPASMVSPITVPHMGRTAGRVMSAMIRLAEMSGEKDMTTLWLVHV